MNQMKRVVSILVGFLCTVGVKADDIPLISFSTAYTAINGFAYDPVTQTFYGHPGYGLPMSEPVLAYNSEANFAARNSSGSITLPNSSSVYGPVSAPTGTYFVVNDGVLYGRPDASSNTIDMWNATTGALLGSATFAGIGGTNGENTFDWGGFSGLNLYNDNGSLYMLGNTDTNWDILSLASDLSVTRTLVTSLPTTLGYAFVINGELFASGSYDSSTITYEVNLATGAESTVDSTFTGITDPYYSDIFYDSSSDQLFVWNTYSDTLYDTSNASVLFNAPASVPEPSFGHSSANHAPGSSIRGTKTNCTGPLSPITRTSHPYYFQRRTYCPAPRRISSSGAF
jgi:hypothetical protein